MKSIGVIGGGNMGSAIIQKIQDHYTVTVCEKDATRRKSLKRKFAIEVCKDLSGLAQSSSVILLAVKPQDMDAVLAELKPVLTKQHLIISIAAGLTTKYFESHLGAQTRVIRTMPNMPAQIGEAVTAISQGRWAKSTDVSFARKLFEFIGQTVVVSESEIDAVTAVSGSGPAYVFLFAESMLSAAKSLGLSEKLSRQLVEQTLLGSLHLLVGQKESAGQLRARVTSKGGTTQAALQVFEQHQFKAIFNKALKAAQKRAGELAK